MKGFLIDTITHEKIEFQYVPPEINREDSPNYAVHEIVGKASPVYQFVSGGERTVQFMLSFHWEISKEDVEKKVSLIRSMTYPETDQDNRIKSAPHPVILVIGELFKDVSFIIKKISTRYHSLFDKGSGLPCQAELDLVLAVHKQMNIDYKTVRRFA